MKRRRTTEEGQKTCENSLPIAGHSCPSPQDSPNARPKNATGPPRRSPIVRPRLNLERSSQLSKLQEEIARRKNARLQRNLELELQEAETRMHNAEVEVLTAKAALQDRTARKEIAELHATLDRLRHEHEETNQGVWKKVVELTIGRDKGAQRETGLRAELARLQEAAAARDATVAALEKTIVALHADAAEQEDRQLAEAGALHGENARLHSENAALHGTNAELHRELARLQREHAALCTKTAGMNAKNAELEAENAGLRENARDNQVGRPEPSSSDP